MLENCVELRMESGCVAFSDNEPVIAVTDELASCGVIVSKHNERAGEGLNYHVAKGLTFAGKEE